MSVLVEPVPSRSVWVLLLELFESSECVPASDASRLAWSLLELEESLLLELLLESGFR